MSARRRLHIVHVLRVFSHGAEPRVEKEIQALEALGHDVTVFARVADSWRRPWKRLTGIRGPVHYIPDQGHIRLALMIVRTHVPLFLSSPKTYWRLYRRACDRSVSLNRFFHAGIVADAARRSLADHIHAHTSTKSARIARWASALTGIPYSVTSRERNGRAGSDGKLFVVPGAGCDPGALEAVIGVVERDTDSTRRGHKPVVLVVDRQADYRKQLSTTLAGQGVYVRQTGSMSEASTLIRANTPDLILAGEGANGSDAFGLLQQVRSDGLLRRVPFVLLAGEASRSMRLRAFREGADDLLVRSRDLEELSVRVVNILTREEARGRGRAGASLRGMRGRIEDMPLCDVAQILKHGQKTARLTLWSDRGEGRIWFQEGVVVHAQAGGVEGEAAFYEMLQWDEGEFAIENAIMAYRKTIRRDTLFLVMEGMRRFDEETREAAATPH